MVITGPDPEQVEDGHVVEPAEFPGVLHEGEITPDKCEEAGGELHSHGGEKKANKNFSKTGKTNEGGGAPLLSVL